MKFIDYWLVFSLHLITRFNFINGLWFLSKKVRQKFGSCKESGDKTTILTVFGGLEIWIIFGISVFVFLGFQWTKNLNSNKMPPRHPKTRSVASSIRRPQSERMYSRARDFMDLSDDSDGMHANRRRPKSRQYIDPWDMENYIYLRRWVINYYYIFVVVCTFSHFIARIGNDYSMRYSISSK